MAFRTEFENQIEYRIVDFEDRIPGGEGIQFLYAQKVWSIEYRFTSGLGVACLVDGKEIPLAMDMSQPAFDRDGLWDFIDQPARIAIFERAAKPIVDLLFTEGIFDGEMEGLI